MIRTILASLTLCASLGLGGCGYSNSGDAAGYRWGGLYRSDINTVAVPVLRTRSFSRGDEIALTQAIVNQIESRTPYKVVDAARADTILEGQLTAVAQAAVSSDTNTAIPQEQLYIVTLDFVWKDLRTGKILIERRNFEQTAAFYPTLGEGRPVGRQQAVEHLAAAIVDEMQRDW
jgi:hypothetical protein